MRTPPNALTCEACGARHRLPETWQLAPTNIHVGPYQSEWTIQTGIATHYP